MNRGWYEFPEPRSTIVCEMLEAWKGRNMALRMLKIGGEHSDIFHLLHVHLRATLSERRDQLQTLRRIRRVVKGTI